MTYFSTVNPASQRYSKPLLPQQKKAVVAPSKMNAEKSSGLTFMGKEQPKDTYKPTISLLKTSKNVGLPLATLNGEDRLIFYKMLKNAQNQRKNAGAAHASKLVTHSGEERSASSLSPQVLEPEDDSCSPKKLTRSQDSQESLSRLSPSIQKTLHDNPDMLDALLKSLEDLCKNDFGTSKSKIHSPSSTPFSRDSSHMHLGKLSPFHHQGKRDWTFVRRDLSTKTADHSAAQTPSFYSPSRDGWSVIDEGDASDVD